MSKVHILPPDIIAKIAAGEVVDRPASVVKELMENSLDAGATTIELHLEQAGKTALRLKDNGQGIAADDMEKVFARHSTSKIQSADDLFNIHSLGFRGEALYSIAAVADVTLRSATAGQESGWEIHQRGGEQLNLRPLSFPVGTEIEVQELFFNTPARRKFLKSNLTEMNQILNIFIPYTLLYPQKRFLLTHQNKTVLDLKPADSFTRRIAQALNLEEKFLLETTETANAAQCRIHLIAGDINLSRPRRDLQFLFINDRPVQSKALSFQVNNVYRLVLPEGTHPFFALFLTLPAADIDVNIHPAKREVKIHQEQLLGALLRQVSERLLMTKGQTKQVLMPDAPRPAGAATTIPSFSEEHLPATPQTERAWDDDIPLPATYFSRTPTEQYAFPQEEPIRLQGQPDNQGQNSFLEETVAQKKQSSLTEKLSQGRYLGAFINKFLLFESGPSLLIIDQHAAQERVTFERLILQMQQGHIEVQQLLSPYIIPLTPQEILFWEERRAVLEEFGFSSSQFDRESIAVHSYPVLLKDPLKAVREILSGDNIARTDHETLARRACRASVMAGDPLATQEAEYLREALLKTRDPFTCPHGRPTVIELKEDFLNKQFLRS